MRRARHLAAIAAVLAVEAAAFAPSGRIAHYTPAAGPTRARTLHVETDSLIQRGFRTLLIDATAPEASAIARFARRRGVTAIVARVRDPGDPHALRAARHLHRRVDAYVVGDDGLSAQRYTRATLERAVAALRAATRRPVATHERPEAYAASPTLAAIGDWILTAPPLEGRESVQPQVVCGPVAAAFHTLRARLPPAVTIVVGDIAIPTTGAGGANEHYQRALYACIESRGAWIAYGEAFDRGTSTRGLFRADGVPKLWARNEAPSAVTPRRPAPPAPRTDASDAHPSTRPVPDATGARSQTD